MSSWTSSSSSLNINNDSNSDHNLYFTTNYFQLPPLRGGITATSSPSLSWTSDSEVVYSSLMASNKLSRIGSKENFLTISSKRLLYDVTDGTNKQLCFCPQSSLALAKNNTRISTIDPSAITTSLKKKKKILHLFNTKSSHRHYCCHHHIHNWQHLHHKEEILSVSHFRCRHSVLRNNTVIAEVIYC